MVEASCSSNSSHDSTDTDESIEVIHNNNDASIQDIRTESEPVAPPTDTHDVIGTTMQEDDGDRDHVEDLTTVTNSVTSPPLKYIDKEYFITTKQRVNKNRKNEDPDWIQLEKDSMAVIESSLKTNVILKVQHVGLKTRVG